MNSEIRLRQCLETELHNSTQTFRKSDLELQIHQMERPMALIDR